MSLLNRDYTGVKLDRVVAASIVRCSIGDIREVNGKSDVDGGGKGPVAKTLINLTLEQPAQSTDGDEMRPGTPVLVSINEWPPPDERGAKQMKEFGMAALGLDRKEHQAKDEWFGILQASGGFTGLKGRHVLVEFAVTKGGFQDVKHWNRVPVTPATA